MSLLKPKSLFLVGCLAESQGSVTLPLINSFTIDMLDIFGVFIAYEKEKACLCHDF